MSIRIKRAYDEPASNDGVRVLVDRLWPRGIRREQAHIDLWLRDVAPSSELRKWFDHDPEKWGEFRSRYFSELDQHEEAIEELAKRAGKGRVTLLFGAKDRRFNNAVALQEYLEKKLAARDAK